MAVIGRYGQYDIVLRLWPTLITAGGLVTLLALGVWQVERLAWKTELNEQRQRAFVREAQTLPTNEEVRAEDEFTKVRAQGVFQHDKTLYLAARSLRGNLGYHVMTPLLLSDGSGTLLVNRGWIPMDYRNPTVRSGDKPRGTVSVTGLVRFERVPGRFVPDNDPEKNFWFFVDIDAMAAAASIEGSRIFYIDRTTDKERGRGRSAESYPLANQTRLILPNDHAHYAFVWFSLALALVVIYVVSSVRKVV